MQNEPAIEFQFEEADSLANEGDYQVALVKCQLISEEALEKNLNDSAARNAALSAALLEAQIYINVYNDYAKSLRSLKRGRNIASRYQLSPTGLDFILGSLYFTIGVQNNSNEYFDLGARCFSKVIDDGDSHYSGLIPYAASNLILFSQYGNVRAISENSLDNYFDSPPGKDGLKEYAFNQSLDSLMDYLGQGRYLEASAITRRLREDKSLPMQRVIPGLYYISGTIASESDNISEAIDYISEAESLVNPENGLDMVLDIYESLEKLYFRIGNLVKAQEYGDKSRDLRKRITTASLENSLNGIEIEEEVNNMRNHLIKEEQRSENLRQGFILITVFSSVSLLFIVILLYLFNRLKENNRILYRRYIDLIQITEPMKNINCPSVADCTAAHESGISISTDSSSHYVDETYMEDIKKIEDFMTTSDKIFSAEFDATAMSVLTGIKLNTLSSAIAAHYQTNFRTFLNSFRVRTVCLRLETSSVYDNFTIDAIAEDVGIKSRTTFTKAFKTETGMTPGQYIKFAKERKGSQSD